jgi:VanZ family protein
MIQILVNWIKNRVNWNAFCYSLHFFISMILVFIGVKAGLKPFHAVGLAVLIGVLKEIYDTVIRGKYGDMLDVICNLCGVAVGWLLVQ